MSKPRPKKAPAPKPSGPNVHSVSSPLDLLLPYQRRWVDDASRFKIGCMSRQVGKDFSSGGEGIRDICWRELSGDKTSWMIAAPSERQSLLSLEKWKDWASAFEVAIEDVDEVREGGSETLLKSTTITFGNGSKVVAVPGKPDTVRGDSANVLMTEFAFFDNPDATWRAILPSITNPLRGGEKRVRLISTPNGQGNKFHDLWKKAVPYAAGQILKKGQWSGHLVDIYQAVKEGLPVDIEELRTALDDPEGWAQEFECTFLDAAAVLLPYELIALIESAEATEVISPEFWRSKSQFPIDLGIDFGRKKDLTCCWALESISQQLRMTREVACLQNMSTPDQLDALAPRIEKARSVSLDYTGPGIGFGDLAVKRWGEWKPTEDKFGKVELCQFTQPFKQDLFSTLKVECEMRQLRIPVSRVIREDLHSIHRVISPNGNVSYRAPMTPDGHADRCTGLALAVRAARRNCGGIIVARSLPGNRRNRVLRGRRTREVAG